VTRSTILVLCAIDDARPHRRCVGQSRFLGEAGLEMARRGVDVLCAAPGDAVGYRPVPRTWEPVEVAGIDAVYDRDHGRRFHQQGWEQRGIPVGNPSSFSDLCDDKLQFHDWARSRGLPVPPTVPVSDPSWQDWPRAFGKPRVGGRGRGVHLVSRHSPPTEGIVQQAVRPRVAGQALRILLQRSAQGGWATAGMMDRRSRDGSPVVSLSQGARALPVDEATRAEIAGLVPRITGAFDALPDANRLVEAGLDVILAEDGPWILECNARPGRSFDRMGQPELRRAAVLRPFETIVGWLS